MLKIESSFNQCSRKEKIGNNRDNIKVTNSSVCFPYMQSMNDLEGSRIKNKSSNIITRYLRKVISDKSYGHMFTHGEMWGKDFNNELVTGIDYMKKVSKDNLRGLYRSLSRLDSQEIEFLKYVQATPFIVTHASNASIIKPSGALEIFSRKKLESKNIDFCKLNSTKDDVDKLANDDFVFFALEPGSEVEKRKSRFGYTIYSTSFDQPVFEQVAWMSLREQLSDKIGRVRQHIPGLSDESYKLIDLEKTPNKQSMFLGKDTKTGIGLSLIKLFRKLPQLDRAYLLSTSNEKALNRLINGIYRPEVKVPRSFYSKQVSTTLLTEYGTVFSKADIDNKDKILQLSKYDSTALIHASARLKNDMEVVRSAIQNDPYSFAYASDKIKDDELVVSKLMLKYPKIFKYVSKRLKDNEDIVTLAVKQDGSLLEYASDRLKNDMEVVRSAMLNNPDSFTYASDEIKDDELVVSKLMLEYPNIFRYVSKRLKDNEDIVTLAVKQDGSLLAYASDRLKDNEDIVILAVEQDGRLLKYASDGLKDNEDIVALAVEQDGRLLKYVSDGLKDNEDIVALAVKQNGSLLEYASDRLKNNMEVVRSAMLNNPY
ncbi:DUF4116 domain-containing protein, partial [Providencia sp. PROV202]|uniref:DUF4116 domain-containing protein n=1 Tax=Providencia sp. PROV202 TaxID=2949902 RepID=UPI00234A436A